MAITIGVSEVGGTFHAQALALQHIFAKNRLPPLEIVTSELGGSIENAKRLNAGVLDLAFVSAPWVAAARNGTEPFSRSVELQLVAPMNVGPNFFVARADSFLRKVSDLRGKRLAIGLRTGGMTPHANKVLEAIGIGADDLERIYVDFGEGAALLANGEVDAQYQRPIPNRVMTDLCALIPLRILEFEPLEIEAALRAVPQDCLTIMRKDAIPGLERDLPQLGVLNLLVSHSRLDDEIARLVANTIINNAVALSGSEQLFSGLPDLLESLQGEIHATHALRGSPLHPGAARAFTLVWPASNGKGLK